MNTTHIANQHPRVSAELARLVKGWESLTREEHTAWVLEVLDKFEDRGEYEIPSKNTLSGRPEILSDTLNDPEFEVRTCEGMGQV